MKKSSIIFFVTVLLAVLFLFYSLLIVNDSAIDINIHDTYFVVSNNSTAILGVTSILFFIYLIKVLVNKFKSNIENVILLVLSLLMIFITTQINSIINSVTNFQKQIIIDKQVAENIVSNNNFEYISNGILFTQFIFILLGYYISYRIGRNYIKK